ncbi:MAG: S8 family serine peptidase [Planctomycetes bacterium]|nr:S8 family serine peptidase [Planctomycetota bacterium]
MTLTAWVGTAWFAFFGFGRDDSASVTRRPLDPTVFGQIRQGGGIQTMAVPDEVVVTASAPGTDWSTLARRNGAVLIREIPSLRSALLRRPTDRTSSEFCRLLRARPGIVSADPNYLAQTTADSCGHSPFLGGDHCYEETNEATLARSRIAEARAALDSAGAEPITIAVLDTGVDATHEELAGAVDPGYDFVSDDGDAGDDNGHGTLVAGLLVADAANDRGIAGIAAGRARILPVKVADRRGCASFAALAAGLTWATDRGARIAVIPLGATHGAPVLHRAVDYALAKGVCLIAAAGNMKSNTAMFPAAYPGVVCVSAVDSEDRLLLSTNVTSETACAAPGAGLITTLPGNMYREMRGTSVSCAVTAGIAALAWSAAPDRTAGEIALLCRAAVDPIPTLEEPQLYSLGSGAPAPQSAASPQISILPPRLFDFGRVNARSFVERALAPGRIAPRTPRTSPAVVSTRAALAVERVLCRTTPDDPDHVDFTVSIRNAGGCAAEGIALASRVGDSACRGPAALPRLAAGEACHLAIHWDVPPAAPDGTCVLSLDAAGLPLLRYDFAVAVPDPSPLRVQYQQSGGIDIIPDAPYRIVPGRPYVPVQIFVPEKGGGTNPNTFLVLNEVSIQRKLSAGDPSPVTIYQDAPLANPSIAPAGLQIVDENGAVLQNANGSPNLNLFFDLPLNVPGHHNIMRIPTGSFAAALPPFAPVDRYLDVRVTWSYYENLGLPTLTQTGTTRKVLKITFVPAGFPTLPGENHYYDTHIHTIAEWYFTTPDDAFAPRKAWGGPIQMIKESAYSIGLTEDVNAVYGSVIVTDHNCFYGDDLRYGNTSPDSLGRRTAFGPTSPAQSPGPGGTVKPEWTRMKELFGVGTAEELTFSQDQQIPYIMPLGAHILNYRSQHIDGPWHGGSATSLILDPQSGPPIMLQDVITTLATQNPTENGTAFCYAAHPFSGQGWTIDNLQRAYGLNGLDRPTLWTNMTTKEFLCRGLQVFNGKSAAVFSGTIVWNDLDPWNNPGWQAGNTDWDAELQQGLVKWHEYIATLMEWKFDGQPNTRFIRKIYVSAGTDAHGDFNYSQGRLATLLDLQATFSLDSSAFGQVRTYVFADGKSGATPAEKWMKAFEDGNTCITDGPVLAFSMDSDMKFDSQTLSWHDASTGAENADGRVGGEGAFDGGRTMLVRRGCPDIGFKYRYRTAPDVGSANGALSTISIYRDRLFQPNPTQNRQFGTETKQQIRSVGILAVGAPDTDLVETINPDEEGAVTMRTAFSLGAFTGGNPDLGELGPNEGRCYTNPVWVVPVDILTSVNDPNPNDNTIPAGAITVTFLFDQTMTPSPYRVEFKTLSASGSSTGSTVAADSGSTNSSWSTLGNLATTMYTCKNASAIPLNAAWPTSGKATVVIYLKDPPLDCNGNAMNPVAKTIAVPYSGGGSGSSGNTGSTGTGSTGSVALTNAQTIANLATQLANTDTSASSGSSGTGSSSGGGGGGGGCFAGTIGGSTGLGGIAVLAALGLLVGLRTRRQAV